MGDALSIVDDVIRSNANFEDVLGVVTRDGLPSTKQGDLKALNMFCAVPSCLMATDLESCGSVLPFASIKKQISRSEFTTGLSEKAKLWAETNAFTEVMTVLARHMKELKARLAVSGKTDTTLELLAKLHAPCQAVPPATAVSKKQDCKRSELNSAITLLRVFLGAIREADHVTARNVADTTRNHKIPYLTDATVACIKAAA